jgi:hypothetical protein
MVLRTVQTGAIWLTAAMTLIAGTPHFVCLCPNGHIKPFCLTLFFDRTCCCNGSCCSASHVIDGKDFATRASHSAAALKKNCCCCNAHQQIAKDETRTDSKLGKESCQKTLVEGIVAVPAPSVQAPMQDLANHLVVPHPVPSVGQDGFGACGCLFTNHYRLPPPTDLVTALQRFLI